MAYTVKQLLESKQFPDMRLVTCKENLNQEIKGIRIIDIEDMERYLTGGELLLTNMKVYFGETDREFRKHLNELEKKQVSGFIIKQHPDMVQKVNYYDILLKFCSERNIPVIEISEDEYYWGIIKYVILQIYDENIARLIYFKLTHDNISNMLLDGEDFEDPTKNILFLLSSMIGNPVALYYSNLTCCASTTQDLSDFVFEKNVEKYKPDIVTRFEYKKQRKEHTQYITKIHVLGRTEIYLVVTEVNMPLTILDYMAYVKKIKNKSVNSFISLIYGIVSIILIFVYLFRRPLIQILTNRDNIFIDAFCNYVLIAFLIQACISLVLVLSAFFQSKDMYVIPRIVLFVSNITVLIVLLIIGKASIDVYFRIIFIGAFLNLVINYLLAIKMGFKYVPTLKLADPDTQKLIALFAPTLLSCGVFKIHTLIDTMITTNIGTGSLTILTYSSQVSGMISNFVIANMLTIAYPQIIRGVETENKQKELWKYAISFQAIICLLVCGFIAIGENGINLLYVKGEFTARI